MQRSRYEEMFGHAGPGRPPKEDLPLGMPTGDPAVTERARRRATRVLKTLRRKEFEELMREEAEWLVANS